MNQVLASIPAAESRYCRGFMFIQSSHKIIRHPNIKYSLIKIGDDIHIKEALFHGSFICLYPFDENVPKKFR